jgi:hypothetical protein
MPKAIAQESTAHLPSSREIALSLVNHRVSFESRTDIGMVFLSLNISDVISRLSARTENYPDFVRSAR